MANKQNKFKVISLFFLLLMGITFFKGITVKAVDESKEPPKFNYQVKFPENQRSEDLGYYDLMMKPGQKQTVQIEFSNLGDTPTTIGIGLNSAKTNSNGVIEYGDSNIKKDNSLKYDFSDLVSAPSEVKLEPGETKMLDIKIEMPESKFDGVIAGGIQIIQDGQNQKSENEGSTVINEYAYLIAMVLQVTDKEILPKLELNSVIAGQSNYRNTVYVNYSNKEAAFVRNMTTEVNITKKGSKEVLYETKQTSMKMAPNTFISFPVDMNGDRMVAGDYTATILVTADDGINEKWTMDFSISKEEANKFNERDVGLTQDTGINWQLIALLVVVFFLLLLLIIFIIRHIRKKNKSKKRKKAHK